MSVIAELRVTPVTPTGMSDEIAKAVDALAEFDVEYETGPMCTVIEADNVEEVFAAAQAAHNAVNTERVVTELEIDHQPHRHQTGQDRVSSLEHSLNREPRTE